jgi:hypothetical protein
VYGKVWDCLRENNYFQLLHFHELEILSLGYDVEEELNGAPHRGRLCSLTPFDDLAIYLLFLSTSESQERISTLMKIDSSVVCNSLIRIRPILNKILKKNQIPKPQWKYNSKILFPDCPYVVDGTSIQIPKPNLSFSEAKKYYNVHHKMYCMNVEVMMMRDNVLFFSQILFFFFSSLCVTLIHRLDRNMILILSEVELSYTNK